MKKLRIFVKLPCGKNLEVHVQNVSPLYFIKNQIEAEEGVAPSLQILKVNIKYFIDDFHLFN